MNFGVGKRYPVFVGLPGFDLVRNELRTLRVAIFAVWVFVDLHRAPFPVGCVEKVQT